MELIECDHTAYKLVFDNSYHAFNKAEFNRLNEYRCTSVRYFLFKDGKYRLGIIAGIRNNTLTSPFSAPFGGFSFKQQDIKIAHIENAVSLLDEYAAMHKLSAVKIILPPLFYNETFLAKVMNVLQRNAYTTQNLDLDYYIDLKAATTYQDLLWKNARKNLAISNDKGFEWKKCVDSASIYEVYEVVAANRKWKEKPMTMTRQEINNTAAIIDTDYFLITKEGQSVAAAIVYHVNGQTAYVPYWGDRPGFSEMKPMNLLADRLFDYYKTLGKNFVHIGIATENTLPNYGLCEFKESIGCKATPKFTYQKNY